MKLKDIVKLLYEINPDEYDLDDIDIYVEEGVIYKLRIIIPPKMNGAKHLDDWIGHM